MNTLTKLILIFLSIALFVFWGYMIAKFVFMPIPPENGQIELKEGMLIAYQGNSLKASVIPAEIRVETLGVKVLTAYSSTPEQTDSTPFITASMTQVRDGIVAYNCLPFGTKIRIPELFGYKIFVVEDRMAEKWGCSRMDLWMADTKEALEFGIKKEMIEILK